MTALLLGWLLAAGPAPAAERTTERAGVVGRARVAPAAVSLAGDVTLTLEIEGAAPVAVETPAFNQLPGWRVRQLLEPETTSLPGNRQWWRQAVRLTPDRPGDLPLPPPAVRVRPGGREAPVEIAWQPLAVRVTTALPRADVDEARGVTEPEPAPPEVTNPWPGVALAAAVVLVGGAAGVVWWRRRRSRPVTELPPAEWARAELDRLAKRDAADPAAADALADVLRGFLARRFRLDAEGRTTAELLARLRPLPLPAAALAAWQALLERCDLARFARLGFAADEWGPVLDRARDLVAASLPVGEAAGAVQLGGAGGIA
jgi:hypothetical protein